MFAPGNKSYCGCQRFVFKNQHVSSNGLNYYSSPVTIYVRIKFSEMWRIVNELSFYSCINKQPIKLIKFCKINYNIILGDLVTRDVVSRLHMVKPCSYGRKECLICTITTNALEYNKHGLKPR